MRVIPFSNATEFRYWKHKNCDQCKKYENKSTSYDKANCKAAFDIDMGTVLGNIRLKSANDIGCQSLGGQYVTLNQKCKMKQNG